jgi:hypothetical protein
MIKITFDTCLINVNQKLSEVTKLEELNNKGLIEIVATDRLIQETENHAKRLEKAESYINIGEPFTVGYSRIGGAYISDGKKRPSFGDIASILFPEADKNDLSKNQSNDVMHLIAHLHSDSDYFVTNNTHDFINAKRDNHNRDGSYKNYKKNQFENLGIKVRTPSELIEELENKYEIR